MRLVFLRHGELPPNPERRMVGSQDLPMSDRGRAQIARFATSCSPEFWADISTVVTSDLNRCLESAQILCDFAPKKLLIEREPGLREISLGAWEGHTRREIEERWPGSFLLRGHAFASFVPPDGESFRQVGLRVRHTLTKWQQRMPEGGLCFVTHACVFRIVIANCIALPLSDILDIPLTYAASCTLQAWPV